MKQANELMRQLDREVFGGKLDVSMLPHAIGVIEDYVEAAGKIYGLSHDAAVTDNERVSA